jgi:hypothetical protein
MRPAYYVFTESLAILAILILHGRSFVFVLIWLCVVAHREPFA